MEKRVKAAFLSGMVLFLLVSCGDVFMSNYGKDGGNLVIRFPGAAGDASVGRAAIPASATLAQLEYRVTLTSGSRTLSAVVPAGETSAVLSVTPGVWNIAAEAYLPGPVHVGTGSAQVTVAPGQSAGVSIKMIFDNTLPASVEVSYMGTTYTAVLEENGIYRVVLLDYDTTGSVAITVNPALPDQDISAVTNNGQPAASYVGARYQNSVDSGLNASPTFTVSANAGEGFSTSYTVKLTFAGYELVNKTTPAKDLKTRFGITTTGTAGVTEAFNALHWLINSPDPGDDFTTDIQLGDWIDLDSLTVAGYPSPGTANSADGFGNISVTDTAITPGTPPFVGYDGRLLRLIVAGINSFSGINGNSTPHVVFQFQNLPGTHRMNPTDTSVGGYTASEMRGYLTGNFYTGLQAAGVPDGVVWAPSRRVANGDYSATGADTITDKLWLPTEWEMFGANTHSSSTYEAPGNQARLEYYTDYSRRIKYNSSNAATVYFLASPYLGSDDAFCGVMYNGSAGAGVASAVGDVAPAFCVK